MYLAPLNYDRFFKKVFSETRIAQRFLEDFFDVTIESIEPLPNRHKITDDSTAVEFDYRCKMNGHYVIVDMQQWYKADLVKRFYVYHCLNSALQLETMPLKSFPVSEEKKKKEVKDYDLLEPALTLIWMADDTMGTDEDFISYALTPEILSEFMRKDGMWRNDRMHELMAERERVLRALDNRTRQLDFLAKNRLIYALQKNIVKNAKYARYVNWFRFAEKSKSRNNRKEDFAEFAQDEIFSEVMRRLNQETLSGEDYQYITDYEVFAKEFKQHEASIWRAARREGYADAREVAIKEGIEKGIEKGERLKAEKMALEMIKDGEPNHRIQKYTGLADGEIHVLRESV